VNEMPRRRRNEPLCMAFHQSVCQIPTDLFAELRI